MTKLGFVGSGNMGGAIIHGVTSSQLVNAQDIGIYHADAAFAAEEALRYGVQPLSQAELQASPFIVLAVKPQVFKQMAHEVAGAEGCYLSVMAGVTLETLAHYLQSGNVVRTMPNLGAQILKSATALCASAGVDAPELAFAKQVFSAVGSIHEIPEAHFDAFTAVAGSSPGFLGLVAEALADAGVKQGLSRQLSQTLAREVLVASGMLLETRTGSQLKDEVSSPGGTTIAGIMTLEAAGLRYAIMQAVDATVARSKELSKT